MVFIQDFLNFNISRLKFMHLSIFRVQFIDARIKFWNQLTDFQFKLIDSFTFTSFTYFQNLFNTLLSLFFTLSWLNLYFWYLFFIEERLFR